MFWNQDFAEKSRSETDRVWNKRCCQQEEPFLYNETAMPNAIDF
jgi:hypothetical protein